MCRNTIKASFYCHSWKLLLNYANVYQYFSNYSIKIYLPLLEDVLNIYKYTFTITLKANKHKVVRISFQCLIQSFDSLGDQWRFCPKRFLSSGSYSERPREFFLYCVTSCLLWPPYFPRPLGVQFEIWLFSSLLKKFRDHLKFICSFSPILSWSVCFWLG